MNILLVAKLSNQTLIENILSPLLRTSYINHIYILRDFPGDVIDGRIFFEAYCVELLDDSSICRSIFI